MIFLWFVGALILGQTTCEVIVYQDDIPYIPIKFAANGEETTAALKLELPVSLFLGPDCKEAGTCTSSNHTVTYDPVKYGGKSRGDKKFEVKTPEGTLTVSQYDGHLTTKFFSEDDALINMVEKSSSPLTLEHTGLIGLGFSNGITATIHNVFNGMKTKQIIFRRGAFAQSLPNKTISNSRGHIVYDEANFIGCEPLVYTGYSEKDSPPSGWRIVSGIQIGDEIYKDKSIGFSIDDITSVPKDVFNTHYAKVTSVDDIPEFTFYFDDATNFTISSENFAQYNSIYRDEFTKLVKPRSDDSFTLGKNVLRDLCFAIGASDDIQQFRLGISAVIPFDDDPKWEESQPPERPKDGDKDKDKEDKGAASTSVTIAALFMGLLMVIVR